MILNKFKIEKYCIGRDCPVFIIAEIGVNHNGNINLAKKLIDNAIKSGANAVKFQSYITEELIRKNAPKAGYQNKRIGKKISQYQMLKSLELNDKEFIKIKKYCDKNNIIFLSTAYDIISLNQLLKINVKAIKLASMDIVNHPLIRAVSLSNKPLLLSTGMSSEKEVKDSVNVFNNANKNNKKIVLLQCNTNYPSKPKDQNLLTINTLKKYVPIIGFSDHTIGDIISIASVALGVKMIERHFTLNKKMNGPDHEASLNPEEFHKMVRNVRIVEQALGNNNKVPIGEEIKNKKTMRRSICAKQEIKTGTIITEKLLAFKRPGDGLAPTFNNIKKIIGKTAKTDINKDQNINFDLLK